MMLLYSASPEETVMKLEKTEDFPSTVVDLDIQYRYNCNQ